MELFTNNYTDHHVHTAIAIFVVFGFIGVSTMGVFAYIYCRTPNVPVDPVLGNLSNGTHSELRFAHSDIELETIANSVLEPTIFTTLQLQFIIALIVLLLIYYLYRKFF